MDDMPRTRAHGKEGVSGAGSRRQASRRWGVCVVVVMTNRQLTEISTHSDVAECEPRHCKKQLVSSVGQTDWQGMKWAWSTKEPHGACVVICWRLRQ